MKDFLMDSRVTDKNIVEFNKRGWTVVDLNLDDELIKNALKGVRKMKSIATKEKNKPRRIYYDHFLRNNIAAVELPFNKGICPSIIKEFFIEAKIGGIVKSIMNWENPCCDLARLFCMGNYKYRGCWHRDYTSDLEKIHLDSNLRKIVLVGINLLPQKGFRILKKEYEFNGINSIIPNMDIDKAIRSFNFPLDPPEKTYYKMNAKIGTALIFDPLIIHQGSNYGERFDFHMKFCNLENVNRKKNKFQDFYVIDILHENYKLDFDYLRDKCNIPFHQRSNLIKRFANSFDYFTSLRRILKIFFLKRKHSYNLLKDKGWKVDFLSNTIFQD